MSKHQIIYTSCMRGIHGVNDGQQVYSYDSAFRDNISDDIQGLFSYQVPLLKPGVIMTETLAETMPRAFIYRRLANGSCALVLNTYLGRDYMGSTGRFGNHLSHVVICDAAELNSYPCEFYGSNLLRSSMEFSEVNCAEKPPYLPEPIFEKGNLINLEKVMDFLGNDNHMDIFKKMFSAMLAYENAKKRLLICADSENIIMWIAALQYALPLKMALNINFSTYEYDPSLANSQICGVIPEGSQYDVDQAESHFTFDFVHNLMPEIEADDEFFDFIDVGMSLSYESLAEFHEFVLAQLGYQKVNERYYQAYYLYCLFSDGLTNLSYSSFLKAMQVVPDLVSNSQKTQIYKKILAEKNSILFFEEEYTLAVMRVLLANMDQLDAVAREQIKELVCEKIIVALAMATTDEKSFLELYQGLTELCSQYLINIPDELGQDVYREKLLLAVENEQTAWQWAFIMALGVDIKQKREE